VGGLHEQPLSICNAANSVYWGGISSVTDMDGVEIADWSLTSSSGFDYRQSLVPARSVPEPEAWTLMVVGLLLVGWQLRAEGKREVTGAFQLASRAQLPGSFTRLTLWNAPLFAAIFGITPAAHAVVAPGIDLTTYADAHGNSELHHYNPNDFADPWSGFYGAYGRYVDPNYGFAVQGVAYGYANLKTGTLKAYAYSDGTPAIVGYGGPFGGDADSYAELRDTVFLSFNSGYSSLYSGGVPVQISLHLDGYTDTSRPFGLGAAAFYATFGYGTGTSIAATLGSIRYNSSNGADDTSGTFNFLQVGNEFVGTIIVPPSRNYFDLTMSLYAHGSYGGVAEYSDTASIGLLLPAGVTFTSGSGVFLSEREPAPLPEPGVWQSMIVGFGLIGALLRLRRTLPQNNGHTVR